MPQKPQRQVSTDIGIADVTWQGPRAKIYKCPMCTDDVTWEEHLVLTPRSNPTMHRHVHQECLKQFEEQGLLIRLTPGGYGY